VKQIKVKINSDGSNVEIDMDGFIGSSCKDITDQMVKALGSGDSKLKDSYYQNIEEEVTLNV